MRFPGLHPLFCVQAFSRRGDTVLRLCKKKETASGGHDIWKSRHRLRLEIPPEGEPPPQSARRVGLSELCSVVSVDRVDGSPGQLTALEALEGLFRDDPQRAIAFRSMRETGKARIADARRERSAPPEPEPLAGYEFDAACSDSPLPRGDLTPDEVVLVSGLPRSGTSMLMRALEAGGMAILTDNERALGPFSDRTSIPPWPPNPSIPPRGVSPPERTCFAKEIEVFRLRIRAGGRSRGGIGGAA